jgi:hypothetical protein
MKTSLPLPRLHEDRKVQKLIERILALKAAQPQPIAKTN